MKLLKKITDKDICGADGVLDMDPIRRAVRSVLCDESGLVALMNVRKFGVYTLPGGGIEEGETPETALKREMIEETGCDCDIVSELGFVWESRLKMNFTLESYYYLTKIRGKKGIPVFTQEEIDEGYKVEWHTIEEAKKLITDIKHENYQRKYIQMRDKIAIEAAEKHIVS